MKLTSKKVSNAVVWRLEEDEDRSDQRCGPKQPTTITKANNHNSKGITINHHSTLHIEGKISKETAISHACSVHILSTTDKSPAS